MTYKSLLRGMAAVRPGATTGDIGAAIQNYAEAERCSVVRDFCGHGLGRLFHDEPNILHYGQRGQGVLLRAGMFFTIEPMINLGRPQVKILSDGWTAVTRDRSLSAQFEHSVGVTETGFEIFTLSPLGRDNPTQASARRRMSRVRDSQATSPRRSRGSARRRRRIFTATANACATDSWRRAARRWPITNFWNCCCFAPCRAAT